MTPRLRESDYFAEQVEMHYAVLQSAEKVGPVLHRHEFFEIFLLSEGKIKHIVNNHRLTLLAGSMTFIRPDDAHYFRPIDGQPCQIINLAVAHQAIYDLFAYLGDGFRQTRLLDATLPPNINLSPSIKKQVLVKLETLNRIPFSRRAEKRTTLRMLLFEMVTQYFPNTIDEVASGVPDWLQNACQAMQKPENFAIGLPKMLEISAVSAEHLSRTVRKYLNQTPTSYINQLRLTYAANLLTHGDRPILDISSEVGFESLSHFYTLFKTQYGQTPRQFRRNHLPQLLHGS